MAGTTRMRGMDAREFGRILVAKGLVEDAELSDCMAEQERASGAGTSVPVLADLLVSKGILTRPQIEDATAAIRGKIRFCPRCETPVPIPIIGAAGEKCPVCRESPEWKEERQDVRVDDTSLIMIANNMPMEVTEAAKDDARKFGKYVLIEQIGKGGAAVVHKAWDSYLGQNVALKFIKPRAGVPTDTQQARSDQEGRILDLLKEARNSIRLRHPNIVPVYDAGRINKDYYIAMEYVEGNTLADHIAGSRKRGAVSPLYEDPRFYLTLLRDIARAVHFAHTREKPVMHCDLKPGNVMIDLSGKPFVLDFGLAKELQTDEDVKGRGMVRGTPAYMAPEQASAHNEDIDPRTDVYGLGAMLYELIAGQPPFWGSVMTVLNAVVSQQPIPPLQKSGGLPLPGASRIEELAMKALEKDKERRPKTAAEFADELDKVVKLIETAAAQNRVMRDTTRVRQALPHLDEQQRRLDAELAVFNIDGARRGYREIAAATQDAAVRAWVEACLVEVGWLETLKRQMIEKLNRLRPVIPKIELLERTIENAEVLKATEKKIVLYAGEKPAEITWTAIRPPMIVLIAEGVCGLTAPQDRLSLGILCGKAGLRAEARKEFAALLGTDLEESAKLYLASLAKETGSIDTKG